MRLFLRTFLLFLLLVAYTWVDYPKRYNMQFPREPGPRFDHQMRETYINMLNEQHPDLVLLGDSTLNHGVDPQLLEQLTGKSILNIGIDGSASALWYLVIKNNLTAAQFKPKYILIVFRDSILTAPGYRVQGSYFTQLDEFAYAHEPLLLQRSFLDEMNPLEYAGEKYLPLYGARSNVRGDIDGFVRYSLTGLAGCDKDCTDTGMYLTFGGADLQQGELRQAVAAAESYLYTQQQLDFHSQVDQSYLPEMIRLTQENHIQLIAVRLKTLASGMGDVESPALKSYVADLSAYLASNNVPFLDFGSDPRLKDAYFLDSIHLDPQGQKIFTELLANTLKPILK